MDRGTISGTCGEGTNQRWGTHGTGSDTRMRDGKKAGVEMEPCSM